MKQEHSKALAALNAGYSAMKAGEEAGTGPEVEMRLERNIINWRFLDGNCPRCGARRLYEIDAKYSCESCGFTGSNLQDGDSLT